MSALTMQDGCSGKPESEVTRVEPFYCEQSPHSHPSSGHHRPAQLPPSKETQSLSTSLPVVSEHSHSTSQLDPKATWPSIVCSQSFSLTHGSKLNAVCAMQRNGRHCTVPGGPGDLSWSYLFSVHVPLPWLPQPRHKLVLLSLPPGLAP
jgi:hypothetical protein